MIVHLHVICHNEIQIAPYAIKYWKRCASHVYIYLMRSSNDGSKEYLEQFKDFITIIYIEDDNEINDQRLTLLKNNVWKISRNKADFVIICDFDEFIYSDSIIDELQYMKNNNMTIVAPEIYHLISEEDIIGHVDESILLHKQIKYGNYDPLFGKHCIFNPNEIEEINYFPGAHRCIPKGNIKYYDRKKIFLFHAKYIGLNYYLDKMEDYQRRLSQTNIKNNWGFEYKYSKERKINLFNDKKKNSIELSKIIK